MTAPHIVDPAGLLGEALLEASPDLMRSLLQSIINALLSADADAVVGAEYGRPSQGRVAQRNGYQHRDLDTRVGTIDVAVPKLRKGTYFPEWLLERRKRAESALITVVADCQPVVLYSSLSILPQGHSSSQNGDSRAVDVSQSEEQWDPDLEVRQGPVRRLIPFLSP